MAIFTRITVHVGQGGNAVPVVKARPRSGEKPGLEAVRPLTARSLCAFCPILSVSSWAGIGFPGAYLVLPLCLSYNEERKATSTHHQGNGVIKPAPRYTRVFLTARPILKECKISVDHSLSGGIPPGTFITCCWRT